MGIEIAEGGRGYLTAAERKKIERAYQVSPFAEVSLIVTGSVT